jgi:hypothetical protein
MDGPLITLLLCFFQDNLMIAPSTQAPLLSAVSD